MMSYSESMGRPLEFYLFASFSCLIFGFQSTKNNTVEDGKNSINRNPVDTNSSNPPAPIVNVASQTSLSRTSM